MTRAAAMVIALDRKRREARRMNGWLSRALPRVFAQPTKPFPLLVVPSRVVIQ